MTESQTVAFELISVIRVAEGRSFTIVGISAVSNIS